jgi:hypothetical protein
MRSEPAKEKWRKPRAELAPADLEHIRARVRRNRALKREQLGLERRALPASTVPPAAIAVLHRWPSFGETGKQRWYSGEWRPGPFVARVNVPVDPSACWTWTGSIHPKGYGYVHFDGRWGKAHRVAYALAYGHLPAELHVLHRCDNPPCVNPDHLFVGTNTDNIADRVRKGRSRSLRGAEHPQAKLTEADVREILSSGEPQRRAAKRYGVTKALIQFIRHRKLWTHVVPAEVTDAP